MEADGLIGQAIIGLSTSLNLKFVTLKCSVQQSSTFNANRTREQVTLIKDKDDLMKRTLIASMELKNSRVNTV